MTDLIEISDVVVDAYAFELRVGDRVKLVFADEVEAEVVMIMPPVTPIVREGDQLEALEAPQVHLRLPDGEVVAFAGQFLRTPVWRWHIVEVRR